VRPEAIMQAQKLRLASMLMLREVDTRDPLAVAARVRADFQSMFVDADRLRVPQLFSWAIDCFHGRHPDYLPIDARYHDLEHTLQGVVCLSALLRGRHVANESPVISRADFELALIAMLFHDTGYLKRRDDTVGTGAKYTVTHVNRSCEFAEMFLASKGFNAGSIRSAQNMIRCTGMGANVAAIPFQPDTERICGFALGTADLLGQMAASDYVEKLPVLYEEFVEAGRFNGNPGAVGFSSVDDLVRKTPGFWEKYVFPKISSDFRGLFRYLARPSPSGTNDYLKRIEANLFRIHELTRKTAPGMPVRVGW
jgi:hypothetical protein